MLKPCAEGLTASSMDSGSAPDSRAFLRRLINACSSCAVSKLAPRAGTDPVSSKLTTTRSRSMSTGQETGASRGFGNFANCA